jgi:hypothetical protein
MSRRRGSSCAARCSSLASSSNRLPSRMLDSLAELLAGIKRASSNWLCAYVPASFASRPITQCLDATGLGILAACELSIRQGQSSLPPFQVYRLNHDFGRYLFQVWQECLLLRMTLD